MNISNAALIAIGVLALLALLAGVGAVVLLLTGRKDYERRPEE